MAQVRDLVDLTLACRLNVSMKYGAVPPNDEQLELRALHAKAVGELVEEIEAEAMDKLAEALGYDAETLETKLKERAAQRAEDKKAEEDGRKLRERQRSGLG